MAGEGRVTIPIMSIDPSLRYTGIALGRPVVAVEDAAFLEAELFAMEQRAKLAENGEGLARAQIERLRGEKTGGDQ